MRTEMSIINEATMLTIDSSASESSATEPEIKKAVSFRQKTRNPPSTAAVADLLLLTSETSNVA